MQHWPSGIRDTTEFPSLDIAISSNLRDHLQKFIQLDGQEWSDYRGQAEATDWGVTDQRIRSYRKMYEKLGLIFKNQDNKIRLSRLGIGIQELESDLKEERDRILSQVTKTAVSILSRYQLRNPTDDYKLPSDCDVLPCLCIWKAMFDLEGKLHHEEMNRVILNVLKMEDLETGIQKIKHARQQLGTYSSSNDSDLRNFLGEPVHTDQPPARIAPWYSFAGWGGLIIKQNIDSEGFRHLTSGASPLIKEILQNPPRYYEAQNEEDWFSYYIGDAALTNEFDSTTSASINEIVTAFHNDLSGVGLNYDINFVSRFIASCLAKPFVIFTGLSGSGKTKLSQAFARWISPNREVRSNNFVLVSVGADWTSRDNILGYADVLDTNKYIKTQALNIILEASNDRMNPYFLVLDEMNLSHVERYFADILSAIESDEQLYLHSDLIPRDNVPPYIDQLPPNLFIIGTVNVDETTYMFSPKVLDRANVIEFTVKHEDIRTFLDNPYRIRIEDLDGKGIKYASAFVTASRQESVIDSLTQSELKEEVLLFFDILSEYGSEFGFRTVKEMARFTFYYDLISPNGVFSGESMDVQILQKVLPKLHGSRKKLEPLLCALATICYNKHLYEVADNITTLANKDLLLKMATKSSLLENYDEHPLAIDEKGSLLMNPEDAYFRLSYKKIIRMLKLLEQNGFTSFTEA